MTEEQYQQFRSDFQSIVWYKGRIDSSRPGDDIAGFEKIVAEKLSKYGKTYDDFMTGVKECCRLRKRINDATTKVKKYEKMGLKHKIASAKASRSNTMIEFDKFTV